MNAFGGRVFDAGQPVLNNPQNVQALDLLLEPNASKATLRF